MTRTRTSPGPFDGCQISGSANVPEDRPTDRRGQTPILRLCQIIRNFHLFFKLKKNVQKFKW